METKKIDAKTRKILKAFNNRLVTADNDGWTSFANLVVATDLKASDVIFTVLDRIDLFEHDPFNAKTRLVPEVPKREEYDWTKVPMVEGHFAYHGTHRLKLKSIFMTGISRMEADAVYMSLNLEDAVKAADKHGRDAVVLQVDLSRAHGIPIYREGDELTMRHVPPAAITKVIVPGKSEVYTSSDAVLSNKMMTPDGTIIESTHVHDFVMHKDKNGKEYGVDGGRDYLRRIGDPEGCIDLSVTESAIHEVQREHAVWGGRGPNGDQPLKFIPVSEMSNDHILNVLMNVSRISLRYYKLFLNELLYRRINDIKIED